MNDKIIRLIENDMQSMKNNGIYVLLGVFDSETESRLTEEKAALA